LISHTEEDKGNCHLSNQFLIPDVAASVMPLLKEGHLKKLQHEHTTIVVVAVSLLSMGVLLLLLYGVRLVNISCDMHNAMASLLAKTMPIL
jgi:hypothetical protein